MSKAHRQPGCVNAHTHLYSGLAPLGMPAASPPPENFVQILERVWWRLDRALDERSLRAAARLYVADALLHGTTTVVDHHESPEFIEGSLDVLADACAELGMRAVLCYGATERNGGRAEAGRGLAECERFITSNARPGVRGVVGLHASFTVSDDTIRDAVALARRLGTVMHVHVAEDLADTIDARRRGYLGPLERLAVHGLPPGSILAHGVHLGEAEVTRADRLGLWLVQNPRSNEANGVGYPRALWASRRVALGTDGFPSDLCAELEALTRIAERHREHEPAAAAALGARLEAGRLLVDERFGTGAARGDWVEREGVSGPLVRVTIANQPVVERGRLLAADRDEIGARAREEAPRLWARMEAL